jgi:hypothetical protein
MAKDIAELGADMAAFDAEAQAGLVKCVAFATRTGAEEARSVHGWQNRTHETVASIEHAANGNQGILYASENAVRLNDGTAPHTIYPKAGRGFLRFEGKEGIAFARVVHHPGTAADPFLDNAADKAEESLDQAVDALFGQLW